MKQLSWGDVIARRFARTGLRGRAPCGRVDRVVSNTCGIQAQILAAAELAIGARVDCTRAAIGRALWQERTLVKVSSVRGTIHLHAADDVAMWMAAVRAVAWWREPGHLRSQGATFDQVIAVNEAVRDALDGRQLTRRELEPEVIRRVGPWARKELAWKPFAQSTSLGWGLIAPADAGIGYGPIRGSEVTFVRLDQWVPKFHEGDPHESLMEAIRRYLRTYGPAKADDFAHWFRAPGALVREAFGHLHDELAQVDVEGYHAWMLRSDRAPRSTPSPLVRLVPDYDCYVIGAAPPGESRKRIVPPSAGTRVFLRGGGPYAALLVDGVVAGVWKRRVGAQRVAVDVEPFRQLSRAERHGLEDERGRLASFYELDVEMNVARRN